MTQPTHHTVESIRAAHLQNVEATRAVAAQVLVTVAKALYAAAASLFLLVGLVYTVDAMKDGRADWPGGYCFAVVPLVAAGVTLHLGATRVARAPGR